MSERCAALTLTAWNPPCKRKGTVRENGRWWCKHHVPSLVHPRNAARSERRQEEWDMVRAAQAEAKAADAEVERRADCYDDLLAALKRLHNGP